MSMAAKHLGNRSTGLNRFALTIGLICCSCWVSNPMTLLARQVETETENKADEPADEKVESKADPKPETELKSENGLPPNQAPAIPAVADDVSSLLPTRAEAIKLPADVDQFFLEFNGLLKQGSARKVVEQFYFRGMIDSLIDRDVLDDLDEIGRKRFEKLMQRKMIGMVDRLRPMAWDEARWLQREEIEADTIMVLGRFYNKEVGIFTYVRYWLRKSNDQWQVFDFEDLDFNLRFSTLAQFGLDALKAGETWPLATAKFIETIMPILLDPDFDEEIDHEELIELGDQILEGNPPAEIVGFVSWTQIWLMFNFGDEIDEKVALDELDELENSHPSMPGLYYLRGSIHQALENHQEAIDAFLAYAKLLDFDADMHEMISDSYLSLGKEELALKHAELGLEDHPLSVGCLCSFANALPADDLDRLEPHFARHKYDEGTLASVIDWCIYEEKSKTARYVFAKLIEHHPESEYLEIYQEDIDSLP